ncbi:putative PLAT/LH2 domain superfamily protein [Helianthus annuus]|nr:putative PLAT/LH2 domain superfamily protein [Helianthus annuus]KAJ0895453.1 putative PLAT/LH2 domain superfamily protein [Helianthus annuus]
MMKAVCLVLLFALIIIFIPSESSSRSSSITLKPQPNPNFKIFNSTDHKNARTCSFTVEVTTSCSSTTYTRDQISLAFGDAYGNQVYVPRIDDPSTRTFERCSSDTFELYGPCTYEVCYLYLYRSGYDGWMPERVDVYGYNIRAVSFSFNVWIPADVWYGPDYCYGYAARAAAK